MVLEVVAVLVLARLDLGFGLDEDQEIIYRVEIFDYWVMGKGLTGNGLGINARGAIITLIIILMKVISHNHKNNNNNTNNIKNN